MVKNPPAMQKPRFDPWVEKIPWRRKWQPTPLFLPEEPMDRGVWWATVHGISKSWNEWLTLSFYSFDSNSPSSPRSSRSVKCPQQRGGEVGCTDLAFPLKSQNKRCFYLKKKKYSLKTIDFLYWSISDIKEIQIYPIALHCIDYHWFI